MKFILLIFISVLLSTNQFAAEETGSICGRVLDEDGKGLIGATVKLVGTTRGTSVACENGYFEISKIPEGVYDIDIMIFGRGEIHIDSLYINKYHLTYLGKIIANYDLKRKKYKQTSENKILSRKKIGSMHIINMREYHNFNDIKNRNNYFYQNQVIHSKDLNNGLGLISIPNKEQWKIIREYINSISVLKILYGNYFDVINEKIYRLN